MNVFDLPSLAVLALSENERVALIGLIGVALAAVLPIVVKAIVDKATDKVIARNSEEHLINKEVLERIEKKVDANGELLAEHLAWHLDNPPIKRESAA